jgi:ferric-dicitrate binding protein FerR (iron transport regulator)
MDKKKHIHQPANDTYTLSDRQEIEPLIAGYLTNDLGEDDLAALHNWIYADKNNEDFFNHLKSVWIASGSMNTPVYRKQEREKILKKISFREDEERKRRQKKLRLNILQYAASFLIFASVGALSMYLWLQNRTTEMSFPASVAKETIVEAPLGSISKIILPDSSEVWLNAGSVIRYGNAYGDSVRSVGLTGEAFFSVRTNPEKPFIVNVNDVTVRALGTKFNVKAYPEEQSVTATLEEGIIDIDVADVNHKKIVLKPNEKVIIRNKNYEVSRIDSGPKKEPQSSEIIKKPQDIQLVSGVNSILTSSWKDKQWKVSNESVTSFASMLARRYNYPVVVRDEELSRYQFSGTIENESIEHILEALRQTAPLDYRIYKDSIVLTMNHANKDKFISILKKSD